MSLEVQQVPVVFTRGVDTKTDPKLLEMGALSKLENAVFTSQGILSKRHGYDLLSREIDGSASSITAARSLVAFGDELLLFTGTEVYSYASSVARWVLRGSFTPIGQSTTVVVRNSKVQIHPSSYALNGIRLIAWESQGEGVRYSVQDAATGTFFASEALLSGGSTNEQPKVVAFNGRLLLCYLRANTAHFRVLNPLIPSVVGVEQTLAGNIDTAWDVLPVGSRLFVAFNDTATSEVKLTYLDTAYVAGPAVHGGGKTAGCIGLFSDPSENVLVAWAHNHDAQVIGWTYNLAVYIPDVVLESAGSNVVRMTGYSTSSAVIRVFYEVSSAIPVVRSCLVMGAPTDFARGVGLASIAFAHGSGHYVLTTWGPASSVQPTYFLLDDGARVVGRIAPSAGGGMFTKQMLPAVASSSDSTDAFELAHLEAGRLISADGHLLALLGINVTRVNFGASFASSILAENLLVAGGVISSYDGLRIVETGFHLFPEGILATPGGAASGAMGAGTYGYSAIYEWTDNRGRTHRSAPSIELSATAVATGSVSLSIPTLRLTSRSGVRIVVYRTTAGGTILYRLNAVTSPLLNDTTVDTITYVDTAADGSITTSEILYTTGGILASIAPEGATLIATYKNRVMLAGLADENVIAFSTATPVGEAVYFNDGLTLSIDARGGAITALAVIDGTLVIFKRDVIFAITGDGPNNAGLDVSFSPAQLITSDAGCTNPASIVQTPMGLMFQSPKGLYLLDRSLQCKYLGTHVEAFNDEAITGACLVPNTNQVRFTISSGDALVYDYLYEQWATFTNHAAVACVVSSERFTFARADGQVCRESSSSWTDGPSTAVKLRIVTGWINFGALQGFQRVRRFLVLGDYRGAHKLLVRTAYDYDPTFTDSTIIDAENIFGRSTYGSSAGAVLTNGSPVSLTAYAMGPALSQLNAAWGFSANDVWAVGAHGLIAHWDGSSWAVVESDASYTLTSVWGSGPGDIWAVGSAGTVRHYNGSTWSAVSVPAAGTTSLTQVRGSASNNVWIVGHDARPGIVLRWDGSTWTDMTAGFTSTDSCQGVIVLSPTNVYVLGSDGAAIPDGTSINRWNGSAWTRQTNPGGSTAYAGVALSATDLYVPTVFPDILQSSDGVSWQKLAVPAIGFITSAHATVDTAFIASSTGFVPAGGNVARGFSLLNISGALPVNGIWAASDDDVWVVGRDVSTNTGKAVRLRANLAYGASSPYGGGYAPYQFERHLRRQKCQAIRISIEDAQSSSYNEGCAINAVTFEVGIKKGTAPVAPSRAF